LSVASIVAELKAERDHIDAAIKALSGVGGGKVSSGRSTARKPMSAAGRAKIAAAQRARWAKVRKEAKK
jgi:hypothetical protein